MPPRRLPGGSHGSAGGAAAWPFLGAEAGHHPSSGIPSYDRVALSAPAPPLTEVCALPDGLALLVQPRMPEVQRIVAPPQTVDVAVWMVDRVELDAVPAPGIAARVLRKDALLLLPAGLDSVWAAAAGMPEAIHLHIPPEFRARWADETGEPGRPLPVAANLPLREVGVTLGRARRALGSSDAFRRLRVQAAALEAAHACLSLGQAPIRSRPRMQAMTPARLRRVRAFVEENLAGEVCLSAMAGCIGLSPSHFSRAFRAETGVSPYAFVVQARVERVKARLLDSRRALSEIALDCGFATQAHMTETFRRATGLPPMRWLREHGRNESGDPP